ncbi:MAG: toprim domain-containing protein [Lactococcus lactis]
MNDLFILSEKNTQQAFKYAEALLGSHKQNSDGFYEGIWNGRTVVIGYLGGHVYEQYAPEDYTEAWNGLTANPYDLIKEQPLIPSEWKIKPKNSKIGKFTAKQLIKKVEKYGKDSYEIYLATDPDREGTVLGQEIFRELNLFDKVTKRVYANDMASSQIKKLF